MGKVNGTSTKPLDEYTDQRLRDMGFKPVAPRVPGVLSWRHPAHRDLSFDCVASNIAGSTYVTVSTPGTPVTRMSGDALIALLQYKIDGLTNPVQRHG